MHCAKILLDRGDQVIGIDNLNDYYDVGLKEARLDQLTPHDNFKFIKCGIEEREALAVVFSQEKPDRVIHLAAQAGVRYSLNNPHAYIDANVMGFTNILKGADIMASAIWSMPVHHLFMAAIHLCRLANMTILTTLSASMPLPKKPMN